MRSSRAITQSARSCSQRNIALSHRLDPARLAEVDDNAPPWEVSFSTCTPSRDSLIVVIFLHSESTLPATAAASTEPRLNALLLSTTSDLRLHATPILSVPWHP